MKESLNMSKELYGDNSENTVSTLFKYYILYMSNTT